jgi:hypothetical protein
MGKTFSTGLLTDGVSQDSSNNIGIGVAPSGTNKFEVSGSTKLNGNAAITGSLTVSSSANAIILPAGQTIGLGTAQIYTGTGGNSGNIFIQGAQTKLYADKVVLEAATAAGVEVIGGTKLSGSFIVSGSATTIGTTALSGSFTVSGSATTIGTTVLSGSLTVSGSITSTSTITAQTLVVQTITSSVLYSSGSNVFGNNIANTQVMTGSVGITGSLAVNGTTSTQLKYFLKESNTNAWSIYTDGANGPFYIRDEYNSGSRLTIGITGAATFSSIVGANITPLSGYGLSTKGTYGLWVQRGATDDCGVEIYHNGTNALITSTYQSTGTYGGMLFYTGGSPRMTISSSGSVLIGTPTENTSVSKLQVKSDAGAQAISIVGRAGDSISQYLFMDSTNATIYGLMQGSSTGGGRITIIAGGSNGVYLAAGGTSWTSNSDERLKNINSTIENAVDKLSTLRAVNFSWKSDNTNKENLGLIAQDVEKVFPQVVNSHKEKDAEVEYLGVSYTDLVPVLVKAIQELKAEINELKNK